MGQFHISDHLIMLYLPFKWGAAINTEHPSYKTELALCKHHSFRILCLQWSEFCQGLFSVLCSLIGLSSQIMTTDSARNREENQGMVSKVVTHSFLICCKSLAQVSRVQFYFLWNWVRMPNLHGFCNKKRERYFIIKHCSNLIGWLLTLPG